MFQNQSNFNQSVLKKAQKKILKKSLVIIAISAVFILLAGVLMLMLDDIILGTVLITLGAFFLLLLIIIIIQTKKAASSSQDKAYQVFFDFDADLIKITVFQDGEIASFSKVFYKDLVKVEEREDYVLIYPTKANFFIMEKSKMTKGNFSDLRTFLYGKLDTKYKLMCKNKSV